MFGEVYPPLLIQDLSVLSKKHSDVRMEPHPLRPMGAEIISQYELAQLLLSIGSLFDYGTANKLRRGGPSCRYNPVPNQYVTILTKSTHVMSCRTYYVHLRLFCQMAKNPTCPVSCSPDIDHNKVLAGTHVLARRVIGTRSAGTHGQCCNFREPPIPASSR